MILAGSSRRGAIDLALHLNNGLDNEKVSVLDVRGASSDSLYDAFLEWETVADQSKTRKCFYSLSINPDPDQRDLTDQEWLKAINHIEAKLGIENQPRAIVFHDKVGESDGELRKHCHVVWLRVNTKTLKAISDSNDYYKLRSAARELAKEFQLDLRRGRRKDGLDKAYDLATSQGKNRDPQMAKQRKATITKIWQEHQDRKAFEIALSNAGYILAQGDRRGHVVIDRDGQIHALARQVDGVKTKDVKARLEAAKCYPTIEQVQDEQRIRQAGAIKSKQKETKRVDLSREYKLMQKLKRMAKRQDKLKDTRRREVKIMTNSLIISHRAELEFRQRRYRQKTAKLVKQREAKKPKGLIKHLRTAIGYETLLKWKHGQQDHQRQQTFEKDQQELKDKHTKELARFERHKKRLEQQATREAASLDRLAKKLAIRKEKLLRMQEQDDKRQMQKQRTHMELAL